MFGLVRKRRYDNLQKRYEDLRVINRATIREMDRVRMENEFMSASLNEASDAYAKLQAKMKAMNDDIAVNDIGCRICDHASCPTCEDGNRFKWRGIL